MHLTEHKFYSKLLKTLNLCANCKKENVYAGSHHEMKDSFPSTFSIMIQ